MCSVRGGCFLFPFARYGTVQPYTEGGACAWRGGLYFLQGQPWGGGRTLFGSVSECFFSGLAGEDERKEGGGQCRRADLKSKSQSKFNKLTPYPL